MFRSYLQLTVVSPSVCCLGELIRRRRPQRGSKRKMDRGLLLKIANVAHSRPRSASLFLKSPTQREAPRSFFTSARKPMAMKEACSSRGKVQKFPSSYEGRREGWL